MKLSSVRRRSRRVFSSLFTVDCLSSMHANRISQVTQVESDSYVIDISLSDSENRPRVRISNALPVATARKLDDRRVLNFHESLAHHLGHLWQHSFDCLGGINDFDPNRQVARKLHEAGRVDRAMA